MHRIARVKLESMSPYSQSKHHETPKHERETSADYEERTWRERMHANDDGFVFIPPMAFKNCLSEAAKFLAMQVPGKGKSTYTKHFEAGVLVLDPLVLDVRKEDVRAERLFVPSNGMRGSGKRVTRIFSFIPEWVGTVEFHVFDDAITPPVFEKHIKEAGQFIGLGRFRPRNNGFYGRFRVTNIEWIEQ